MTARKAVKCKSEVGPKRGQSEEGRGWRNRLIGQMVTEIVSEAKAGHFAGLIPVILPLLDGGSSHRNGTTGDPNQRPTLPLTGRCTLHACRMHAENYSVFSLHSDTTCMWRTR